MFNKHQPCGWRLFFFPIVTLFGLCEIARADSDDDALWKRLDITQDGWLDGKELGGGWVRFDADGDGEVTKREFLDGRARERAGGPAAVTLEADKKMFSELDSSGNGYLSGSELEAWNVRRYDANGDKRVTLEEFLDARNKARGVAPPVAPPISPLAKPSALTVIVQGQGALGTKVDKKSAKPGSNAIGSGPKAIGDRPAMPASNVMSESKIAGLFYMQKYWIATRHLEKAAWYFSADGKVYVNPESGFSSSALAAHKGEQGTYEVASGKMNIAWAKGEKSSSEIEFKTGGFYFAMGMYLPIEPFKGAEQIVGVYEGGSSLDFNGGATQISKTLELQSDGTFSLSGIATAKVNNLIAGGQGKTTGTWALSGYTLILNLTGGETIQGVTFPFDDEQTKIFPDRLYFSGIMYKKKD